MAVAIILIKEVSIMFDDMKDFLSWTVGMEAVRLMADMEKRDLARIVEGVYGETLRSVLQANEKVQDWMDDVAKLIVNSQDEEEESHFRGAIRVIYEDPEMAVRVRKNYENEKPLRWMAYIRLKKFMSLE